MIIGYYGIVKYEADSAIVASKVPLLELTQLRMGMVNGDLALLFEEQPYRCAVRLNSLRWEMESWSVESFEKRSLLDSMWNNIMTVNDSSHPVILWLIIV